ncbi:MAG: hypothetical protein AABW80_01375 [Nanoarchaeota archaeon]
MRKGLMLLAFAFGLIVFSGIVFAAENDTSGENIDKAYQCLKGEIDKRTSLSFQEAVFSTLALGSYKENLKVIDNEKYGSQSCWPKSGCKIKETGQALLALDRAGRNTDPIEKWLLGKNGTADDLSWFLEIDIRNQQVATCSIKYKGLTGNVQIGADSKISGSAGSCLSISDSDYLLKIRESCLGEEFAISCNQDFVTTLIYQKTRGDNKDCLGENNITCFVSGETHAASSLGTTVEKIKASCFKSGGRCDYEGSLWAAIALAKTGNNIDIFAPYLLALAEDSGRYFPEAFLLSLIGDDDSFDSVIQQRKQGQFWEIQGSPYNRFYDTALGLLGLNSRSGSTEVEATQSYLLGIQTREGCWNNNNIRDTAFLLYTGWQKSSGGGGSGGSSALCEEAGFSCERLSECQAIGGSTKENFECTGVGICCSLEVPKTSCEAEGGAVCSGNTECDGRTFEASSGQACCLGACIPTVVENICEDSIGGTCRFSCEGKESATSDSCGLDAGSICCVKEKSSGGSGMVWIIILIILIIIIALAILYRHKIQLWWHSRKGDFKSRPVVKPGIPPAGTYRPMQMRPMFGARPMQGQQPARRPAPARSERESELDDTLKKLRDMSK